MFSLGKKFNSFNMKASLVVLDDAEFKIEGINKEGFIVDGPQFTCLLYECK